MQNTPDFERQVGNVIEASIATKKAMLSDSQILVTVAKVSEILVNALKQGNKALFFGNGGSAADAQHIAAELVGRFAFFRTMTSMDTCKWQSEVLISTSGGDFPP